MCEHVSILIHFPWILLFRHVELRLKVVKRVRPQQLLRRQYVPRLFIIEMLDELARDRGRLDELDLANLSLKFNHMRRQFDFLY